ncbi:hypothetical protein KKA95_01035 [Patescibacteria group bacterium]|nr:hypothetical protein [Patescibacteria group bacterium]
MKKIHLFIIILIAIVAFAAADYYANISMDEGITIEVEIPEGVGIDVETDANLTQALIDSNPTFDYGLTQRSRTNQLFEVFDLSTLDGVRIYKNVLTKKGESAGGEGTIVVYEVHGDSSQGKMTYLNLKLKVIDQLEPTTSINEVSNFGYNAFFYNDINSVNSGFILSQIRDNLYGFQYSKADDKNFEIVKNMIQAIMDMKI